MTPPRRTLAEFMTDLDQLKPIRPDELRDAVIEGDKAAIDDTEIAAHELRRRQCERAGVTLEEVVEEGHARMGAATDLVLIGIATGTPPDEQVRHALAGAFLDGFLAGVLWEQDRTPEIT